MRPSPASIIRYTLPILLTAFVLFAGRAFGERVIYQFQANGSDGITPYGRLLESHGKLYATASSGGANGLGAVVELVPSGVGGPWTETVIYSFAASGDAASPQVGLVRDKNGVLYGTSCVGGANGNGAAYQLVPPSPPSTAWAETVVYSFTQHALGTCPSELTIGSDGQFYGTTRFGGAHGRGTVFKLAKQPDGTWRQPVLYSFAGGNQGDGETPLAGVTFDSSGNLYGTTSSGGTRLRCRKCGTVFELQAPTRIGDPWTEILLYGFGHQSGMPFSGLTRDDAGNLFGTTTEGNGAVFKLSPPGISGGDWTFRVLHQFSGGTDGSLPLAGLTLDASGNLYGTTAVGGTGHCGCGTVFQLAPPGSAGGTWTWTVLYDFTAGMARNDGAVPEAVLIFGPFGALYGTTTRGIGSSYYGTVFKVAP